MNNQELLELNSRLSAKIIELEDKLAHQCENSVPVTKEYQIGDLAAILKNVVEGNGHEN